MNINIYETDNDRTYSKLNINKTSKDYIINNVESSNPMKSTTVD